MNLCIIFDGSYCVGLYIYICIYVLLLYLYYNLSASSPSLEFT